MYEKVYIDIVFMANFFMDYVLLRLVFMMLHYRRNRIRCALGAAVGAVFSCIYLFISGRVPVALYQMAVALLMIFTGGVTSDFVQIACAAVFLYVMAFLCGGLWRILCGGTIRSVRVYLFWLAVTYFGLTGMIKIRELYGIKRKNIYPITLIHQGKKQESYGFCDTGNLLTDPVSGQPVSVIEQQLLQGILPSEQIEKLKHLIENTGELKGTELSGLCPKVVSCRFLVGEVRILPAVTLEELCIHTSKGQIFIRHPVFAVLFEPSALGKEYKVLLNSRLMQ